MAEQVFAAWSPWCWDNLGSGGQMMKAPESRRRWWKLDVTGNGVRRGAEPETQGNSELLQSQRRSGTIATVFTLFPVGLFGLERLNIGFLCRVTLRGKSRSSKDKIRVPWSWCLPKYEAVEGFEIAMWWNLDSQHTVTCFYNWIQFLRVVVWIMHTFLKVCQRPVAQRSNKLIDST